MSGKTSVPMELARTNVTVRAKEFELTFQATVPSGPTTVRELLPLAYALSDVIVREGCRNEEAAGRKISCSSGCGACCRSLVAISQVEARQISELVGNLPKPRREAVEARFADARHTLQDAGLLAKLETADSWSSADYTTMVGKYFSLGIPCPFLEEESCSIYSERPTTCREFLVTSPPEHCAKLGSDAVRQVRLPLHIFNAVARWGVHEQGEFLERWVPMILAPAWAQAQPDERMPKPGLQLLRELLECIDQYDGSEPAKIDANTAFERDAPKSARHSI